MTIHADTPLETAIKIVEIDGAVKGLTDDVHDIKDAIKGIASQIEMLGRTHALFIGLQETVNNNARRSDDRFLQFLESRRADMDDYRKWREKVDGEYADLKEVVDSYKGAIRLIGFLLILLFGSVVGMSKYYMNSVEEERKSIETQVNHNEEVVQDRLHTIEKYLDKDDAFRDSR